MEMPTPGWGQRFTTADISPRFDDELEQLDKLEKRGDGQEQSGCIEPSREEQDESDLDVLVEQQDDERDDNVRDDRDDGVRGG